MSKIYVKNICQKGVKNICQKGGSLSLYNTISLVNVSRETIYVIIA